MRGEGILSLRRRARGRTTPCFPGQIRFDGGSSSSALTIKDYQGLEATWVYILENISEFESDCGRSLNIGFFVFLIFLNFIFYICFFIYFLDIFLCFILNTAMSGEGTFDLYSLSELLHAVHWPQIGCIFRCLFFSFLFFFLV